jgi:hypothetical protein
MASKSPILVRTDVMRFDAAVVQIMRDRLACQSKECVMDTLGISSNTWQKIKRGEPIRRSIGERLLLRIEVGATPANAERDATSF